MVVIFKPTVRCNIKCAHCYVGDSAKRYADMTLSEAKTVLGKFPRSEVVLHGGEPCLMGVAFYEELWREFAGRHRFSMQTNLTLIDDSWVPFISDVLDNRISTSFDVFGSLRPVSRSLWLDRIGLLKRNGIRPFVVSVLWTGNQDRATGMYEFFSDAGLSFRINYIENMGNATSNGFVSLRHDPMKYAQAIKAVFDMWFMNPKADILVDPCAEILSFMLLGNSARKCPFTSGCFAHIMCVHPNGDVYPCGGFDSLTDFSYGNLLEQSFSDLASSESYVESGLRYLKLPEHCRECEFFGFCEGGCRLEALSYYGDMHRETSMCGEYKEIFKHIRNRIDSEKGDVYDWWLALLDRKRPCEAESAA